MAHFSVIKLRNWSPTHFGTGRENYDSAAGMLHADTLTAALAAMIAQTGRLEGVEAFLNTVRLSSAFPYYKNRLFLPKMQGRLPVSVEAMDEMSVRKQLKKISHVELPLWQQLVNGEKLTVAPCQLAGSLLAATAEPLPALQKSQVNERVAVGHDGEDAEPFFFEWNFFEREAGLFVLTDATGALLADVLSLFAILGEQGVGTDRSVGGGRFEVEPAGSVTLGAAPEVANAMMLLSTYLPREDEMAALSLSSARYSLLLRGGFMAGSEVEHFRHLRKRSVYMFGEGSVFPTIMPFEGKVVDLRPDWQHESIHPVYRSGRPLCVSVKNEVL